MLNFPTERQKVYGSDKPKVEVGTCMLKKTTTSEKTETAFIRLKSIKQHAEQTIIEGILKQAC